MRSCQRSPPRNRAEINNSPPCEQGYAGSQLHSILSIHESLLRKSPGLGFTAPLLIRCNPSLSAALYLSSRAREVCFISSLSNRTTIEVRSNLDRLKWVTWMKKGYCIKFKFLVPLISTTNISLYCRIRKQTHFLLPFVTSVMLFIQSWSATRKVSHRKTNHFQKYFLNT